MKEKVDDDVEFSEDLYNKSFVVLHKTKGNKYNLIIKKIMKGGKNLHSAFIFPKYIFKMLT